MPDHPRRGFGRTDSSRPIRFGGPVSARRIGRSQRVGGAELGGAELGGAWRAGISPVGHLPCRTPPSRAPFDRSLFGQALLSRHCPAERCPASRSRPVIESPGDSGSTSWVVNAAEFATRPRLTRWALPKGSLPIQRSTPRPWSVCTIRATRWWSGRQHPTASPIGASALVPRPSASEHSNELRRLCCT